MASSSASRLRKYVAEEGVSHNKITENFCLIGTPLPSLTSKTHDANEYKPVWEQEVRDEQGRRRLHGAFTGGWSAGYYNTAGSKEGWTPGTFKSSRREKEQQLQGNEKGRGREQRVEDFMDEEDLEELRSGKMVGASEAYAYGETKSKMPGQTAVYDPLLGALGPPPGDVAGGVEGSIAPTRRTLGLQLLTRMGWRPGTGLGPRVSLSRHRALSILAGLTPSSSLEGAEASEAVARLGVAPPDSKLVKAVGWDARRGLGSEKRGSTKVEGLEDALRRARREQKAAAPGDDTYGEDAVYALNDDIHTSTLARPLPSRSAASPTASSRSHAEASSTFDPTENRWSDGRAVLRGFRIATHAALGKETWFAPPSVPKGWVPDPSRVWASDTAAASATMNGPLPPGPPPLKPSAATLRPDDRASILGEARNPGPPPSILSYLSSKDRERLERAREAAASGGAAGVAAALAPPPPPSPDLQVVVPPLEAHTAQAALRGFIPFADAPAKQARYRAYLVSQLTPSNANASAPVPLPKPAQGQTIEALNHELQEFAKSAGIFRPSNSAIASRFTSAAHPSSSGGGSGDIAPPIPGLYQPVPKGEKERADLRKPAPSGASMAALEEEEKLTPAQQAARRDMFGPLTRASQVWAPEKLLCKRFGVPPPAVGEERDRGAAKMEFAGAGAGGKMPTTTTVNATWEAKRREIEALAANRAWEGASSTASSGAAASKFTASTETPAEFVQGGLRSGTGAGAGASSSGTNASAESPSSSAAVTQSAKAPTQKTLANVGLGEDEAQGRETLTYVKPSLDIFKAVFASDDEDSDDDEKEIGPVAAAAAGGAAPITLKMPVPVQAQQTSAPPTLAPAQTAAPPKPPGPNTSDPSIPFRPTFVAPSKRRAEATLDAQVGTSSSSSAVAGVGEGQAKKKIKKEKKKGKTKGMLTFDLDDE